MINQVRRNHAVCRVLPTRKIFGNPAWKSSTREKGVRCHRRMMPPKADHFMRTLRKWLGQGQGQVPIPYSRMLQKPFPQPPENRCGDVRRLPVMGGKSTGGHGRIRRRRWVAGPVSTVDFSRASATATGENWCHLRWWGVLCGSAALQKHLVWARTTLRVAVCTTHSPVQRRLRRRFLCCCPIGFPAHAAQWQISRDVRHLVQWVNTGLTGQLFVENVPGSTIVAPPPVAKKIPPRFSTGRNPEKDGKPWE